MDFGDKIKDLPVDKNVTPPEDEAFLFQVLQPIEQNPLSDPKYIIRLVAIGGILFFLLNQPIIQTKLTSITKNTKVSKVVSAGISLAVVFAYYRYSSQNL
jgi:hypothetical protein